MRPAYRDAERPLANKTDTWVRLVVWLLLLGLEFDLGADIIRSAISPTWEQLRQLDAITFVRRFLNYSREKDTEKSAERHDAESTRWAEMNT